MEVSCIVQCRNWTTFSFPGNSHRQSRRLEETLVTAVPRMAVSSLCLCLLMLGGLMVSHLQGRTAQLGLAWKKIQWLVEGEGELCCCSQLLEEECSEARLALLIK